MSDEPAKQPETKGVARRLVLFGVSMAALSAAAAASKPRFHEDVIGSAKLTDVIPTRVGDWTVADVEDAGVSNDTATTEYYDQVASRTFDAANKPPVMLLIAYGAAQSGLMKLHRPDVCYDSSGFRVFSVRNVTLPIQGGSTVAARQFHATRGERDEHVLYWTRVGDAFPTNLDGQRLFMFEEGLRGVIPDGVLVRMSTLGADDDAAQRTLREFAASLVESSSPVGRRLLVGALNASKATRTA